MLFANSEEECHLIRMEQTNSKDPDMQSRSVRVHRVSCCLFSFLINVTAIFFFSFFDESFGNARKLKERERCCPRNSMRHGPTLPMGLQLIVISIIDQPVGHFLFESISHLVQKMSENGVKCKKTV